MSCNWFFLSYSPKPPKHHQTSGCKWKNVDKITCSNFQNSQDGTKICYNYVPQTFKNWLFYHTMNSTIMKIIIFIATLFKFSDNFIAVIFDVKATKTCNTKYQQSNKLPTNPTDKGVSWDRQTKFTICVFLLQCLSSKEHGSINPIICIQILRQSRHCLFYFARI